MQFCSSRTLPGHAIGAQLVERRGVSASGLLLQLAAVPLDEVPREHRHVVAAARAAAESSIGNTDRRKYRSSRNCRAATAAFRSRLVAATTRTSTCSDAVPPTRSNGFSSSARRIFAWSGERQLADLVEKQRAAMRQLETARLARVGAGERALLVAEQLGLEQRLGNRGAVDGDERPVVARAERVQRAREQLLAGAALALEQHRRVGRRSTLQRD